MQVTLVTRQIIPEKASAHFKRLYYFKIILNAILSTAKQFQNGFTTFEVSSEKVQQFQNSTQKRTLQ